MILQAQRAVHFLSGAPRCQDSSTAPESPQTADAEVDHLPLLVAGTAIVWLLREGMGMSMLGGA